MSPDYAIKHTTGSFIHPATLLGTGKPVPSDDILATLRCSEATLTRTFKELRDTWSAEIRYRKASHTYEMTDSGTLDRKTLKR